MKKFFEPIHLDGERTIFPMSDFIGIHTSNHFPEIKNSDVMIIGIGDEDLDNEGGKYAPTAIRKAFYQLYPGNWSLKISDLGNIIYETTDDLVNIFSELLAVNKKIIVLGGSQKNIHTLAKSIQSVNSYQNISLIDSILDFNNTLYNNEEPNHTNYLNFVLSDNTINLNNFSILGIQSFYNASETIEILDKLYIDYYFLGELKENINSIEPELRDAHLIGIDINAIENSYFPAQITSRPNGLNGMEICKIARFGGLSDKNKIFGIFEMNPYFDKNFVSAHLSAQIIWYYLEGKNIYFQNQNIYNENLLKFFVNLDLLDLIFYKDEKTERWWVEFKDLKIDNKIFACSFNDYKMAVNKNLSKRLKRILEKNKI